MIRKGVTAWPLPWPCVALAAMQHGGGRDATIIDRAYRTSTVRYNGERDPYPLREREQMLFE